MTVANSNFKNNKEHELEINSNWDQYRGLNEPNDRWFLRKKFLSHNCGKVSEHLLFCLAETFASIEIFGSKYPAGTAELIAKLSADFVGEIKIGIFRGDNGDSEEPQESDYDSLVEKSSCVKVYPIKVEAATQISPNNVALQSLLKYENESNLPDKNATALELQRSSCGNIVEYPEAQIVNNPSLRAYSHVSAAIDPTVCTVYDLPRLMEYLDDIFLLESGKNSARAVLVQSFKWCRKQDYIRFELSENRQNDRLVRCDLIFGARNSKNVVFHGDGKVNKEATKSASEKALAFFKKLRPTIKINNTPARKVKRQEISPPENHQPPVNVDIMSASNSVAVKMMQAMGWKGGGLGRNEDGASAPVSDHTVMKSTRTGLGYSSFSITPETEGTTEMNIGKWLGFEEQIDWFLHNIEKSLLDQDVQFPSNFSRQERKMVHVIAQRMGLCTESYGVGSKRHLVVSRKLEPKEIFRFVVQSGGETLSQKAKCNGSSSLSQQCMSCPIGDTAMPQAPRVLKFPNLITLLAKFSEKHPVPPENGNVTIVLSVTKIQVVTESTTTPVGRYSCPLP
ncbi:unnamed protein product [Allacma fusca]|uniref:Uncharacterized protein n=1 Tax=Allacma fusca TaxID=39272 RepID=A0A8J2KAY6_9HEXA|nr:unnamed protein product [Allacma fusca]